MSTRDELPLALLRRLSTHVQLDAGDRQALLALPWALRAFEPQGYIVREGDEPTQCGVLVSGFAMRQKLTGAGTRQIVSLHVPGDPLDFQNLYVDESDHNLQAMTRATVSMVSRAHLRELARARPAIGRAIHALNLIEASISREWILNIGRRSATARIAHVLCEIAVRLEAAGLADRHGFEFPITQEQLADVVGLTPVHVNRTLKALERQGMIQRDKRRITVPEWQRLCELGDFIPRYLHLGARLESAGEVAWI